MDGGAVKQVDLRRTATGPIVGYDSVRASSALLADGSGEARFWCVRIEPGGEIGRHEAGFGQLFLVVEGSGWAEGGDGKRVAIAAGQGVWIARGEHHAKGSETGLRALIVQVRDIEPRSE
jgi:quercetin dioxygenase-like cupin family protein